MPLPLAVLLCVVSTAWWPVLLVAVLVRAAAAWFVSSRVLRAKLNWILVPVEDLAAFVFWVAGFTGNNIHWRGRQYRLRADGTFELVP